MKKLAALLMAASLLLVAGCGDDEKVIDGSGQNSGEESSRTEGSTGSMQEEQESADGYVFTFNGTAMTADADAGPIVDKLGEPVSYYEAASCAFEGLDKIYSYNGFDLNTYPSGDKDYVSAIVLRDDSVSTAEGICIGDSRDKVQEAYGADGSEESGMLVYEKGGMKLCFIFKDDSVAAIEYRSTVLEQ